MFNSKQWWPGGLGKVSTHAVVFAKLVCDGQELGVYGIVTFLFKLPRRWDFIIVDYRKCN